MPAQLQPDSNRSTASLAGSHLAWAALVAVSVLLVCLPVLGLSIWLEEAMLFSNYPIAGFMSLFSPLPYYDQAATPLYSLFASSLAGTEVITSRSASLFFISFSFVAIIISGRVDWKSAFIAYIAITTFLTPLLTFSELKHYGFEVIGTLICITWFICRDPEIRLNFRDLTVLTIGMIFGISTLIVSGVSIALFLLCRHVLKKNVNKKELSIFVMFFVFALLYYILLKHITEFQIGNYPDAYANKSVLGHVRSLLSAVNSTLGNSGLLALALALALLMVNIKDAYSQRLLLISLSVGLVFVAVTALGMYPVGRTRHLTWSAAFFSAITFYSIYLSVTKQGFIKLAGLTVLVGLLLISITNSTYLWRKNYERVEHNQAISLIRNLPTSHIGLWVAGQPIIDYYSKIYPDLMRHTYFGRVNAASADRFKTGNLNFKEAKNLPGGWGTMGRFRTLLDYKEPAMALIDEAPRDKPFYIFASHSSHDPKYDGIHGADGVLKARVDGLHSALTDAGCEFRVEYKFKRIQLYKAFCSKS